MGVFDDIANVATFGATGASSAASATARAAKRFRKQTKKQQIKFEDFSSDFSQQFQDLSDDFDPLDLQNEYDLLYEAVIQPMERDFSENVLPQIRQSYSGGGYGSALFSGGRESVEANARQTLSMNSALLKMQGREAGIARNFQDYDRRRGDLGIQYDIGSKPIQQGFVNIGGSYAASTDAIAAEAAASQAWGNFLPTIGSVASGFIPGASGSQPQPQPQPGVDPSNAYRKMY